MKEYSVIYEDHEGKLWIFLSGKGIPELAKSDLGIGKGTIDLFKWEDERSDSWRGQMLGTSIEDLKKRQEKLDSQGWTLNPELSPRGDQSRWRRVQ